MVNVCFCLVTRSLLFSSRSEVSEECCELIRGVLDNYSMAHPVGHSLLLARLPGTHRVTISAIRRLADNFTRLLKIRLFSVH